MDTLNKNVNTFNDYIPLTKEEQLSQDLYYANGCYANYWAQTKFKWTPRKYQILLLGCLDRVYTHPLDYPEKSFRGKVVSRFAWRIGRQSGKTEALALSALYLSICKPIKYEVKWGNRVKANITPDNPTGMTLFSRTLTRGAEIIMASADADKANTVFERVVAFLESCQEYKEAMDSGAIKVTKHPFPQIVFNIGDWTKPARVVFRGPGATGQAARSKTYDYKLYDEADYMPPAFFAAELATEINAGPNALTILSSTPSGKRANFFKACFGFEALVAMSDTSLKQIKDIRIGDEVLNRYGQPAIVSDVMMRETWGKLIRIKIASNFESFRVTPAHKMMAIKQKDIYCNGCESLIWEHDKTNCILYENHRTKEFNPQYIQAVKLKAGDYVVIPRALADRDYFGTKHFENKDFHGKVLMNGITSFWGDEYVYVPIVNHDVLKAERTYVYNLTVEGDHSYTVHGIGVANCTDTRLGYKEFHFPSWENPNYNEAMDRKARSELTDTDYGHEIMADWGTVEQGVFDWTYFQRVFNYKYKNGKEVVKPEYKLIELTPDIVKHIGETNFATWLNVRFTSRNNLAKYYFGADLGYSADPSEFVIFEEFNGVMKMVLRIHMEHLTYDTQSDIVALLDTHYLFKAMGMDNGNSGQAVGQILQSKRSGWQKFAIHGFDKKLMMIPFGGRLEVDRKEGKPVTVPAKEAMTNMLIYHAEQNLLILPGLNYDNSIENQFRNHQYSIGAGGQIIYSKGTISPDHCLVPGTLITTSKGYIPIENVKVGDYALTRNGYNKVVFSGKTFDIAKTLTIVLSDGRTITGTDNHPIYVKNKNKFVTIGELELNDEFLDEKEIINKWKLQNRKINMDQQKKLNSMMLSIEGTQKLPMLQAECTSSHHKVANRFIEACGDIIMDQSPKNMKSIINSEILMTIPSKTLSVYQGKNMTLDISLVGPNEAQVKSKWNILKKLGRLQKNGMRLKKAINGINSMDKKYSLIDRTLILNVKFVRKNLSPYNQIVDSVPLNAKIGGKETKTQITGNLAFANGVKKNSKIKDMQKIKNSQLVPVHVVAIYDGPISEVYDLTVENDHEFYANGILVSNCIDACRCAIYAKAAINFKPKSSLPKSSLGRAKHW